MADQAFPVPPETVSCPKCLRKVVVAATPNRVFETECGISDCPINNDPENRIGELWGTLITFELPSEISQQGRVARFAEWEKRGVEAIEADLLRGGSRFVGGPPAVRDLAWEWVRKRSKHSKTRASAIPRDTKS